MGNTDLQMIDLTNMQMLSHPSGEVYIYSRQWIETRSFWRKERKIWALFRREADTKGDFGITDMYWLNDDSSHFRTPAPQR